MKTTIAALVIVIIAFVTAAAQQITDTAKPEAAAVVTMDPPCPLEPPRPKRKEPATTVPVRVRYNPAAPGAKLTTPETLTLNVAINASSYANNYRTYAMSRLSDGTWETTIPVQPFWSFLIFLVRDQNDRIDSNQGNYWQILSCSTDGTPTLSAISYLTESYGGYVLAPGIQLIAARSRELRAKAAAEFKPVPLDRETPSFEFVTLNGAKLDNTALKGQLVILNFWADWCGPCAAEMPGFLDLQRRNPNVKVIGVAVLSELKNVHEIIKRRKWDKLTMAYSEATGAAFGITSVPQTYVIDKEGRLRFVHTDALADVVAVLEKELALIVTK